MEIHQKLNRITTKSTSIFLRNREKKGHPESLELEQAYLDWKRRHAELVAVINNETEDEAEYEQAWNNRNDIEKKISKSKARTLAGLQVQIDFLLHARSEAWDDFDRETLANIHAGLAAIIAK